MVEPQKYPYKILDSNLGMVDRMPYLPLTLSLNRQSLTTEGLLDTGGASQFCNKHKCVVVKPTRIKGFKNRLTTRLTRLGCTQSVECRTCEREHPTYGVSINTRG